MNIHICISDIADGNVSHKCLPWPSPLSPLIKVTPCWSFSSRCNWFLCYSGGLWSVFTLGGVGSRPGRSKIWTLYRCPIRVCKYCWFWPIWPTARTVRTPTARLLPPSKTLKVNQSSPSLFVMFAQFIELISLKVLLCAFQIPRPSRLLSLTRFRSTLTVCTQRCASSRNQTRWRYCSTRYCTRTATWGHTYCPARTWRTWWDHVHSAPVHMHFIVLIERMHSRVGTKHVTLPPHFPSSPLLAEHDWFQKRKWNR